MPLLANVGADDPFAATARDQRIRLLVDGGDREAALAEALAATRGARPADDRLGPARRGLWRARPAAPKPPTPSAGRSRCARDGDDGQAEWTLWLMRGGALDQAGQLARGARARCSSAYRLAPEQPFVLNYLGYAQLDRRENVAEAERLIREAHRLAPDNAAITDSLGWALYPASGELPEAIALLERAAEGEPADVEINEHLGDAYFAAGRRVEARFAWAAALGLCRGRGRDPAARQDRHAA